MAKELAKTNNISVITSKILGAPKKEKMYNFIIYRVGAERKYSHLGDITERALFIKGALQVAKQIKADLVDGSNFLTHPLAWHIARKKNIPVVAWYPDLWLGRWNKITGTFYGWLGCILERYNLHHSFNGYIAISNQVKWKLVRYGVKSEKVKVIPCGVDFEEINSIKKIPEINKARPLICCASRLVSYKRVKDLIVALSFMRKDFPKGKAIIIGQGPEENRIRNLIKRLDLTSYVVMLGHVKKHTTLLSYIKSADIFCHPSTVEGFGITTVEAMALGTPHVVANLPVNQEVTMGKGGLFFESQDPKDLYRCICKLLTNVSLYRRAKFEAKDVVRRYNWKVIAKDTELLYESINNHRSLVS